MMNWKQIPLPLKLQPIIEIEGRGKADPTLNECSAQRRDNTIILVFSHRAIIEEKPIILHRHLAKLEKIDQPDPELVSYTCNLARLGWKTKESREELIIFILEKVLS